MLHLGFHVLGCGHSVSDVLAEKLTVAFLEPMNHHAHRPFCTFEFLRQFAIRQTGGLTDQAGLEKVKRRGLTLVRVLLLEILEHRIQQGQGPLALK